MKEPIEVVLRQYPLKVKRVTVISYKGKKGVWKVDTDRGTKILKKFPGSKSRLRFILAAVEHLQKGGVRIPKIVTARSGEEFAEAGGSCFVLSDYEAGPNPEYDSKQELQEIMKALAIFHRASKGFNPPAGTDSREHLGKWADGYRKHLEDLEKFKRMAARDKSKFSTLFLQHADTYIRQGKQALAIIESGVYTQWCRKVRQHKNLCHQDFASGNLVRTKRGIVVLDMDSLTYDVPARDLRKIMNKVMKKKEWSREKATRMLSAYHSVNPLSDDEYRVLYADLLFPNLFYGISSKYFQRREKEWNSDKFLEKLKLMVRSEQAKQSVLADWDRIIKQVRSGKE
ncbi:CotS family spore coat protein [Effusibacillus lacus]|uniref:Aminoglycoside phosphotransferase domain-containing protein n=1 Tax=Effusibacillus lacus TaxID=1348429 RepID=A0A292YSU8_9BACL|nr:CotS family spore coat protein [Effusibacillus lacus]TCS73505.1 spore coat-associated protein S [Effusibacillus lacus]GAX91999.1 hypothetical protein EFBL_3690 [Effusibacillus lacus]